MAKKTPAKRRKAPKINEARDVTSDRPLSKLRGVCLCTQAPNGDLHVNPECPIHGKASARVIAYTPDLE